MEFVKDYDIEALHPADYNPRKIADGAFTKLQESLRTFGVCKAVIINRNGVLVAGHQRTKAMKAVGIKKVPVFLLDKQVAVHDEIRFNLMHNSIETESTKTMIKNADKLPFGFSVVKTDDIVQIQKGKGVIVKEISNLIAKYGDWGSVVIDEKGVVIHNSDYAFCCSLLNKNLVVYKMKNELVAKFLEFMGIDYGSYNYEALGIKPYVQTHCQMNRNMKTISSTLYDNYVLPNITPHTRMVDFGAGKMAYVKMLQKKGYPVLGYEPHLKKSGSEKLDVRQVVKDILRLRADIKVNGLYDVVVLDSVINSITSNEFEHWVLTSCNSLMKKDGVFYTGTRNIQKQIDDYNNQKSLDKGRYIEFLDKDNFGATFRKGVWTLQKFHGKESLEKLLMKYFEDVTVIDKHSSQLWAICKKPKELRLETYAEALNVEFNMEYPGNYRHNMHKGLVDEILKRHK